MEYRSEAKFGIQIVNALMHKDVSKHFVHQSYTNADFLKIATIKTRKPYKQQGQNDDGAGSDGAYSQDDEHFQNVKLEEDSHISKLSLDENGNLKDDPL